MSECLYCKKKLGSNEKVLYVEEEKSRIFCSEDCILSHFQPTIERLEGEYLAKVKKNDLEESERVQFSRKRFSGLDSPDEVWVHQAPTGDRYYHLIKKDRYKDNDVWAVSIALFLRGEPSFLFLTLYTNHAELVDSYRVGQVYKPSAPTQFDGLAEPWTDEETHRARAQRGIGDIPESEFSTYEHCINETLETPDEVWSSTKSGEDFRTYHFIRQYQGDLKNYWFVIIAKETDDEDQIELIEAFPTRDMALAESFRAGTQEIGQEEESTPLSRVVH